MRQHAQMLISSQPLESLHVLHAGMYYQVAVLWGPGKVVPPPPPPLKRGTVLSCFR